jgi:hypothetical protein
MLVVMLLLLMMMVMMVVVVVMMLAGLGSAASTCWSPRRMRLRPTRSIFSRQDTMVMVMMMLTSTTRT